MRLDPDRLARLASSVLCLLLVGARLGAAQIPASGARIRVRPATCRDAAGAALKRCPAIIGRLIALQGDSLVVETVDRSPQTIALGGGTRVDVSTGAHGHALLGVLGGAVAGLVAGEVLATSEGGCSSGIGGGEMCGMYDVIGLAAGAGLGALVGALIRTEGWRPVTDGVTLRLAPGSNGMLVGIGMRF